jgi:hypothetical protein
MPFTNSGIWVLSQTASPPPNASCLGRLEDQLMSIRVMYDHVAPNACLRGPHHLNPGSFQALTEVLEPSDGEYRGRWLLAIRQVEAQSGIAHSELEKLAGPLATDVQPEEVLVERP